MNILVIGKVRREGFALHDADALSVTGISVPRFEPRFHLGHLGSKFWYCIDQVRKVYRSLFQISEVGQ